MIGFPDVVRLRKVCAESQELAKALAKRGLNLDLEHLHIEPWPVGTTHGMAAHFVEGRAPVMVFFWERLFNGDNHYAHPVEGLSLVFDRLSNEILEIQDRFPYTIDVPKGTYNYHAEHNKHRFGAFEFKPLTITQPDGVSFTLDNRLLKWHKWQLHIGFSFREGILLRDIRFDDRPVCYEACIAEMVVPYGAAHGPHARKNVFDIGEVGFGLNANELELGCDCKGSIQYLDAWITRPDGHARCIRNAVCIHEEDHGVLWKHTDYTGKPEVRRSRRLVMSAIHTVGNYEYGCYWYFMMDGSLEFEMKATGIINTVGSQLGREKHGTEVALGVVGQVHQHIFTAKLDMAIDGDANTA